MADSAMANLGKYKSGTTMVTKSATRGFVKSTPFKIVDNYSAQELEVLGMKKESYPTPTDPHKT